MSASSKNMVSLPGTTREPLPDARVVGPTNPTEQMEVTLVLRPKAPQPGVAALSQAAETRPYLTRQELAANYGASDADLQQVREFAQGVGLTVRETDAARRTVVVAGTAAQMQAAFGVTLQDYQLANGATHRGRTGPVQVPRTLAKVVEAVLGLDNRPQARPLFQCLDVVQPTSVLPLAAAAATPFTPIQVAQLYGFPQQGNGQGQCVGIIELGGGYVPADLTAYWAELGIQAPTVTAVSVDGASNKPGSDADTEVMLDIEVVGAIAPGAKIVVYFAPNTSRGFYDAISTAIHDTQNQPSVISISWGAAEGQPNWTTRTMQTYDQAFQAGAALGVTVCCASGDSGSSDGASDGRSHVDFPASSPYTLACGGTKLQAAGQKITSEVVWNENPTSSATGGGVSKVFALPTWQSKAKVPRPPNSSRKNGRGVPDVAGDADPVTGYKIRVNGADTIVGGTSAVAPLWAALVALLNQSLAKPVGYLNPVIYGTPFGPTFHDVTSGNNGAYSAGPGWDPCTGLGTPNGGALLHTLQGA